MTGAKQREMKGSGEEKTVEEGDYRDGEREGRRGGWR